jgi:aspartate aminotransferase-like enzyme
MAFVSVSAAAWEIIAQVDYAGYGALKPFRTAQAEHYFPYTPNWHGVAGLNAGAELILKEGLSNSFSRHAEVADFCRQQLKEIGLTLFPAEGAISSPTVTAVNVPAGTTWPELDSKLRRHGLVAGGSFGPLSGKVFRLGHMGTQADLSLIKKALAVIRAVV